MYHDFSEESLWHTAHSNPLAELPTQQGCGAAAHSSTRLEPRSDVLRHVHQVPLDSDSIADARTVPIERAARSSHADPKWHEGTPAGSPAPSQPSTASAAAAGRHRMEPQQLQQHPHLCARSGLHAVAADTEEAAAKAAEAAAVFDAFARRRAVRAPVIPSRASSRGGTATHPSTASSLQTLRISPLHSPATSSSEQVSATLALRTRDTRLPVGGRYHSSSGPYLPHSRAAGGGMDGSPQRHLCGRPVSGLSSGTEVLSEVSTLVGADEPRPSGPAGEGVVGDGDDNEDEEGCLGVGRASTCASVPWPSHSGSQCGGFDDTAAESSQPATLEAASATTLPLSTHGTMAAASPLSLSPSPSEARRGHLTERTRRRRPPPPLLPRPASAPEPWPGGRAPPPRAPRGAEPQGSCTSPGGFAVDPGTRRPCGRVGGFGVSSWVRRPASATHLAAAAWLCCYCASQLSSNNFCLQFHLSAISFLLLNTSTSTHCSRPRSPTPSSPHSRESSPRRHRS